MTADDIATFAAAITTGHEVRIEVGESLIFGSPIRIEGRAAYFEARGGSGVVQSYNTDSIAGVVVLASRTPRPARRGPR